MLEAIKAFFQQNIASSDAADKDHALKLATAALLVEMTRMDDQLHDSECEAILDLLAAKFQLSEQETHDLLALAQAELDNSTDYFQFTALINQHFDYEDKKHIVELLWQVAYADGVLDKNEEYLVRKISELIYVSHEDFIAIKLSVRNEIQETCSIIGTTHGGFLLLYTKIVDKFVDEAVSNAHQPREYRLFVELPIL